MTEPTPSQSPQSPLSWDLSHESPAPQQTAPRKYLTSDAQVMDAWQLPAYATGNSVTAYLEECLALAKWCGGTSHMMREDDEHGGPVIHLPWGHGPARPGDWIVHGGFPATWTVWPDHAFQMNHEPTELTAAQAELERIERIKARPSPIASPSAWKRFLAWCRSRNKSSRPRT